jgi:hypothetical protein
LSKTKSDGAWLKKLSSTTSRYFTIDFDRQLFYYTHSESSKKISNPVSFREITGAERMPQPAGSSKKKSSKTTYGFSVTTQSRTFELYTTSNPDAAQWVYALNAAKDIAAERSAQGPATAEKPAECQEAGSALPPKPVGGLAPLKPGGRRIIEASRMDNPDAQEVAADAETIAAADRQEANTPDVEEATGSDSGGPQPPCKPPPAVNSDRDAFAALQDLESLVGSGAPATPPALKQASLDPAVAFASKAEAGKSAAEKGEMAVEKAEAEKMAAEKAEAAQFAEKKAEAAQLAAEKVEAEQLAAKTAEAEKLAAEKAEADKLAVEKAEAQKLSADKAEAEKLAGEKAEAERLAVEKAEAERLAVKKAEAEQLAAQQAKADKLAAEKAEAEKLVATKAEADKLAAEKAEDEKLAAEKDAAQKASSEKAAAEKALAENADAEKASAEQAASEKALKQKLAADKLAADILSADDEAPKAVEALDEKEQGAKTACTPELVVASAVEQNPLKPAADTAGDTADAKAPNPAAEKVEEEKKPEAASAVPAGGALPPLQKKPVPGALPPLSGGGKAAAWSISFGNEDEGSKSLASAAPPLRNKAPDRKEKKKAKAKAFNCGPPVAEQEGNKEASGWDSEGEADGKSKSLASAAPPLKSRSSDRKKEKREKKSSGSSIPAGPANNQDGKEASGWDSDGEKNSTIKAAVVHSPVVKSASASTAVAAAVAAPPAMKEASGWDSDDDAKEKPSNFPPAPANAPGAAPSGFDDDSDDDEAAFGKARKEAKMSSKAKVDSCGASQPAGNGGFVVAKLGSAAAATPRTIFSAWWQAKPLSQEVKRRAATALCQISTARVAISRCYGSKITCLATTPTTCSLGTTTQTS